MKSGQLLWNSDIFVAKCNLITIWSCYVANIVVILWNDIIHTYLLIFLQRNYKERNFFRKEFVISLATCLNTTLELLVHWHTEG